MINGKSFIIYQNLKIYTLECIPDYRNSVIVAKNPLAARRATSYAERLRLGIAVIHGEAKVCSLCISAHRR